MTVDPKKLRIQIHPAAILREKAEPVDPTEDVLAVADRMVKMMRGADGIGLAATQVGLRWRLFVCDVPADPDEPSPGPGEPRVSTEGPEVYINPEVVSTEGEPDLYEEGCLSLPGVRGDVIRPPAVTMRAIGLDGQPFETRAGGLLARCLQHELDHLDGILILDRMTQAARTKVRSAVRSLER